MVGIYLTTPGASMPAPGTATPGLTMAPGDISGLTGSTSTPIPGGNTGIDSPGPAPATHGGTVTPSLLLSGLGYIAILSLVGHLAWKRL